MTGRQAKALLPRARLVNWRYRVALGAGRRGHRGDAVLPPAGSGRHRAQQAGSLAERSGPRRPGGEARREVTRLQADQAVEVLYESHYRVLVQVAVLLAGDIVAAEDIVQAAFVAMHRAWRRVRTRDDGLAHLLREVVRRARSARRARPGAAGPRPPGPASRPAAALLMLRDIPDRQREAVVLRCLAGLQDWQIAAATGVRPRTASRNLERGLAAFAATEPDGEAGAGP